MSRVKLDKIAFRRGKNDRLLLAPERKLRVYELDGVTLADGYTTEAGGALVTYPLVADKRGRYSAWYEPADYWIEDVPSGQRTLWPAVSARDLGGRELGLSEITANFTTASTAPVDVPGLTTAVVVGIRPIKVILDTQAVSNSSANGNAVLYLVEDGVIVASASFVNNPANTRIPMHRERRRAPSAGSHTYKVQAAVSAGTMAVYCTVDNPAMLQVVEC